MSKCKDKIPMPNFTKVIESIKKNPNQSYIIVIDSDETIDDFLMDLKKEMGILESDFVLVKNIAGESVKIGEIKKIHQKLQFTSQGKINLAVIAGAESLTPPAANSLLKILEEPPRNSLILLFTQNCDKIISTIVSRCKKFILRCSKKYQISEENRLLFNNIKNQKTLNGKFKIAGEITIDEEKDLKKILIDWAIIMRNCNELNQYRIVYKYLQMYNKGINKKLFLENLILELF